MERKRSDDAYGSDSDSDEEKEEFTPQLTWYVQQLKAKHHHFLQKSHSVQVKCISDTRRNETPKSMSSKSIGVRYILKKDRNVCGESCQGRTSADYMTVLEMPKQNEQSTISEDGVASANGDVAESEKVLSGVRSHLVESEVDCADNSNLSGSGEVELLARDDLAKIDEVDCAVNDNLNKSREVECGGKDELAKSQKFENVTNDVLAKSGKVSYAVNDSLTQGEVEFVEYMNNGPLRNGDVTCKCVPDDKFANSGEIDCLANDDFVKGREVECVANGDLAESGEVENNIKDDLVKSGIMERAVKENLAKSGEIDCITIRELARSEEVVRVVDGELTESYV
jgi:hypothetical protein